MKLRPSTIRVIGDGTATVELFGKYATTPAVIDEKDIPIVIGHRWFAVKDLRHRTTYARAHSYVPPHTSFRMHRLILGVSESDMVDHRDGNGLNNRRSNIRTSTQPQNARNRVKRKNSACRYKGVWLHNKKWRAVIYTGGRNTRKAHHLGVYASQEEAAQAYDQVAREFHGEFAALNFPKEGERGCVC